MDYRRTLKIFKKTNEGYKGGLSQLFLNRKNITTGVSVETKSARSDKVIGGHSNTVSNLLSTGTIATQVIKEVPVIDNEIAVDAEMLKGSGFGTAYNPDTEAAIQMKYNELGSLTLRRQDRMVIQAVIEGKVDDSRGNTIYTYDKNTASTINGGQWGVDTANPFDDIGKAVNVIRKNGGNTSHIGILFGATALGKFIGNKKVNDILGNRTFAFGNKWDGLLDQLNIGNHGTIIIPTVAGKCTILSYSETYKEIGNTTEQDYIPSDKVIVFPFGGENGENWYGGVDVITGGNMPSIATGEIVFDNRVSQQPVGVFLRARSRYFPVIDVADRFVTITVR